MPMFSLSERPPFRDDSSGWSPVCFAMRRASLYLLGREVRWLDSVPTSIK